MDALIQNFLNVEIMRAALPFLLKGLGMTAVLCVVVVPLGLAGGLGVALLGSARRRWIGWPVIVYVDFFRAFPPLVLLIFIYFGLPFLRINVPAFVAVALAFLLNTARSSARGSRAWAAANRKRPGRRGSRAPRPSPTSSSRRPCATCCRTSSATRWRS
jgi:His/Glu/Gln/Arg/opine family amino acid ABC transporter permease subunit